MATLIFDIETVGEDFGALDETTQEVLTRWIKKEADDKEEYEQELLQLKDGLGFSPLTGSIVALGILDDEKGMGVVYFQSPGTDAREFAEGRVTFKPMSEKDMLEAFWAGARVYDTFVSFNGRGFDAPFLAIRSAIHGIRPTKDLMSNRYLGSQPFDTKHVDLLDQLTYYGAVCKRGNLHLWCRAFGIKSPKADGITGDDVGRLFREKKYADIARYNVGDLDATRELYHQWRDCLKFAR